MSEPAVPTDAAPGAPADPIATTPAVASESAGEAPPTSDPEAVGDWRPPGLEAWSTSAWESGDGFTAEGGDGWASASAPVEEGWAPASPWSGPRRTVPTTPPPPMTIADEPEAPPPAMGIQEWDEDEVTDAVTEPPPPGPRDADDLPPLPPPPPKSRDRATPTLAPEVNPPFLRETPKPAPRAAAPPPKPPEMWVRPDFDDDDQEAVNADEAPATTPWTPWKVGAAVALGASLSLAVALVIFVPWSQLAQNAIPTPPDGAGVVDAAAELPTGPRAPDAGGVEVRRGLRSPPRYDAVDPAVVQEVERAALRDPPDLRRPVTPTAAAEVGEIGDVGQPAPPPPSLPAAYSSPAPAPQPARAPASVGEVGVDNPPPPAPAPVSRPKVAAPDPATLGTLKIRANRRVLVYVDGKAIGYAPTDYLLTPGTHSVRAMLPGQPASAQTQSVDVAQAGSVVAMDFAF